VFGNVDPIVKGAFAQSIEAWQDTGRTVPLHWNHSADPDDIVGHVVPGSMVETDRGLVVEGQLDLEGNERARKAWRAMKTGSIGLSFGYLTQKHRKAADGANELLAIDLRDQPHPVTEQSLHRGPQHEERRQPRPGSRRGSPVDVRPPHFERSRREDGRARTQVDRADPNRDLRGLAGERARW
jgi:HK97 family phage prohead protease